MQVSNVRVVTINGLHYLYNRDVNLRQCFLPREKERAEAIAARLNQEAKPAAVFQRMQ